MARETQPCNTGSKGPSKRGAGMAVSPSAAPGARSPSSTDTYSSSIVANPWRASLSDPGPLGEIFGPTWRVPGEVAVRQRGQCLLAIQCGGAGPSHRSTATKACSVPTMGPRSTAPCELATPRRWVRA